MSQVLEMQPSPSQDESQETSQGLDQDVIDVAGETPAQHVFIAPSIHREAILGGGSYTHHSAIPQCIKEDMSTECVLGVDEAGRGPVLGPMVYALLYLPKSTENSLLRTTHHFDDSKALTPSVRSALMQSLCTESTDLHQSCGWATRVMSARDISAGMLRSSGTYNLNNQAMDATVDLIQGVFDRGVNVKEVYIDTIGNPAAYQKKLERIFPTCRITVAKKADSLYPCVSAASVCAKVTRDAALEVCYETYEQNKTTGEEVEPVAEGWGSGYPSDARCTTWLKRNMDPMFGWGAECRFSWGTAKDMVEAKGAPCKVDWPEADADEDDSMKVTSFFSAVSTVDDVSKSRGELADWFGRPVTDAVF